MPRSIWQLRTVLSVIKRMCKMEIIKRLHKIIEYTQKQHLKRPCRNHSSKYFGNSALPLKLTLDCLNWSGAQGAKTILVMILTSLHWNESSSL